MTGRLPTAAITVALLLALLGAALAITIETGPAGSRLATAIVLLLASTAVVAALWTVWGRLPGADSGGVSWSPDDAFATPSPERTSRREPLAGTGFAAVVDSAGLAARRTGIDAAVEDRLRPFLRARLERALVAGGMDPPAAAAHVASGAWTDDRLAASVLSPTVDPPDRPLTTRVHDWLLPERALQRRASRAAGAVARVADEAVPPVPGREAPRPLPVLLPPLEDLHQDDLFGVDRAVDPHLRSGTAPPAEPDLEAIPFDAGEWNAGRDRTAAGLVESSVGDGERATESDRSTTAWRPPDWDGTTPGGGGERE